VNGLKIAIIRGSTRPGRNGKPVADWVVAKASSRKLETWAGALKSIRSSAYEAAS
jgi:hypothetical protein